MADHLWMASSCLRTFPLERGTQTDAHRESQTPLIILATHRTLPACVISDAAVFLSVCLTPHGSDAADFKAVDIL